MVLVSLLLICGGAVRRNWSLGALAALGVALAAGLRLIWLGNVAAALLGITAVAAFSCALSGFRPFFATTLAWCPVALLSGIINLIGYGKQLAKRARLNIYITKAVWVPFVALVVFAFIFTMANPVLWEWTRDRVADLVRWLNRCPITVNRIFFWSVVLALFSGLMRARLLTGELALPIGLHIAWNFFEGNVFGFPTSGAQAGATFIAIAQGGPELWTGGLFGPEAGLVVVPALLLGAALIYLYTRGRLSGPADNWQLGKPAQTRLTGIGED